MSAMKSLIPLLLFASLLFPCSTLLAAGPFQGKWESNYGILDFVQEGEQVTGSYSCCNGEIKGRAAAGRMEFDWKDPVSGTGWGRFTLSDDGNRLDGVWAYAGETKPHGQWRARRLTPAARPVGGQNAAAGSPGMQDGSQGRLDQNTKRQRAQALLQQAADGVPSPPAAQAGPVPAVDPGTTPEQARRALVDRAQALARSNRCSEARPLLKQALHQYRQLRGDYSVGKFTRHGAMISEINLLTQLAYCDFVLDETRAFARSLSELVKVREEVSHIAYLRQSANPLGGPFQQIAEWIDSWRARFETDAEKKRAGEKLRDAFDEAIRFLIDNGNDGEALVVSENLRSRAFGDLLAARPQMRSSSGGMWSDKGQLLSPATTPYLSRDQILEQVARRGTVTVEYHLLDDKLLIWVVQPSGDKGTRIRLFQVRGGKKELSPLVDRLVRAIETSTAAGTTHETDQGKVSLLLRMLHRQLIAPIPRDLLPEDPGTPVTLVPHDVLFRVPFPALVTTPATPAGGRDRYLMERHALVLLPSIAIGSELRTSGSGGAPSEARGILALVNPRPLSETIGHLPPLDETQKYFPEILKFYPAPASRLYVGTEAVPSVLAGDLSGFSVVYFATHAEANDEDPRKSWIALAERDGNPSLLRPGDVEKIRFGADLVILAACQTGGGKITGDGVDGLGRAFIFAGADSLLSTLWKVTPTQTLQLVYDFHRNWRAGESKASALRRAQMELAEEYNGQPELWSAFSLMGEWR